jgi:hypothetical protein
MGAMKCNIDAQGARLRLVYGIMALLTAAMLTGLAVWAQVWWLWLVVAAAAGAGVFALFEARKRWCVLRAMGLKTPL